jgi:predicted acetyltransferase
MSREYRPVPEEDVDEFRRLLTYAFSPTERHDPDEDEEPPPSARLGDRRGVYDGDELCCTGRHHWFTHDVRGSRHAVAGLSAVSTPPWHRRRGLVRRLLAASLAEYREREQWFSTLWPFEHPFYASFGWATTSDYAEVRVAPADLDFVDDVAPAGDLVELDADRWADCEAVYRAANDHALAMYRTEEWWRKRVLRAPSWNADPYVAGVEREADGGEDTRLAGYVVYDVEEGDDDRRLVARELCAVDHAATVELLRYLRYHDSQVGEVRFYRRPDGGLFDLLTDPRAATVEHRPGPMVRLVDVERALAALDYPEGVSATLAVAVDDGFAEWNDATFRLAVEDGHATCERTGGSETGASDADASVGVGALSQLAVGYRSASRLHEVGRLDADASTVGTLEALFPETDPVVHEGF